MTEPNIDIQITQQQLFALSTQFGLKPGPLSPLQLKTAEQQALAQERVISPDLVGSGGKLKPELLPAFKALADPQAYVLFAYVGRLFTVESVYYYPDAASAAGNVSLTDTDEGLKLHYPGVKENVFFLHQKWIVLL